MESLTDTGQLGQHSKEEMIVSLWDVVTLTGQPNFQGRRKSVSVSQQSNWDLGYLDWE